MVQVVNFCMPSKWACSLAVPGALIYNGSRVIWNISGMKGEGKAVRTTMGNVHCPLNSSVYLRCR